MKEKRKRIKKPIEIIRPPLSRTFDVPSPENLLKVFEGDSVKLIFKGGTDTERMWVTITQAGNMDHWAGTLDNDPVTPGVMSRIKYRDRISFHPFDVIDIDLHKRFDQREHETQQEDIPIAENKISKPWYKNPQTIVTIIVGLLGATATIIAALL